MNLIDLRKFEYETNKIISFKDNELIFGNTEYEEGIYKRYFYKYDIKNKYIYRINKYGINTCENAFYTNLISDKYIYTNSYNLEDNETETLIYRVNLMNGEIEKLYSMEKDANVIFLNQRYALLRGSDFEMDKQHSDSQMDARGAYEYAFLCDLEEEIEYEIKDERVVLGIRDYFIPFTVDNRRYIVFEEAYMEDWELEELYQEGAGKADFYHCGYRESINIISVYEFVESIREGYRTIPFNQINKTELTGWTRYFGMDNEKIYYRMKDFESEIENIYSVEKKTLDKRLVKSIKMESSGKIYSYFKIWHDIEKRRIYEIKIINNNKKEVREIMHGDFDFQFDNIKEGIHGFIDNFLITAFWTEDNNGDNYRNFVKIRDMKSGRVDTYEGISVIINDSVILLR